MSPNAGVRTTAFVEDCAECRDLSGGKGTEDNSARAVSGQLQNKVSATKRENLKTLKRNGLKKVNGKITERREMKDRRTERTERTERRNRTETLRTHSEETTGHPEGGLLRSTAGQVTNR
jgi:hypothetical protein